MVFNGDLMMFNGDLMMFNGDLRNGPISQTFSIYFARKIINSTHRNRMFMDFPRKSSMKSPQIYCQEAVMVVPAFGLPAAVWSPGYMGNHGQKFHQSEITSG